MESDSPRGNAPTLTCYGIAVFSLSAGGGCRQQQQRSALNMMMFILLLRLLSKTVDPLQDVSDIQIN